MVASHHTKQGSLLYHSHHTVGVGHLMRALALVTALQEHFDVTFLSGGVFPQGLHVPETVEFVQLPALIRHEAGLPVSVGSDRPWTETIELRRAALLAHLDQIQPRVIVIESFPFGHRLLMSELLSLLDANRAQGATRATVFASIRDMMERDKDAPQLYDDLAAGLANAYYDGVLVHTDPQFATLDETFQPKVPLRVPVYHTGFVTMTRANTEPASPGSVSLVPVTSAAKPYLLASVGGGRVGGALLRTVLKAFVGAGLAPRVRLVMVTGPFLPEDEFAALERGAEQNADIQIVRWTDNLRALMQGAVGSVSQCGYNTTMDILASGVPALVVPYHTPHDLEQSGRAAKLAAAGVARVLNPAESNPVSMQRELRALLKFTPTPSGLRLDGTATTTRIITDAVTPKDDDRP